MRRGPRPRALVASRVAVRALRQLLRKHRAPHTVVQRGRIVLMGLQGAATTEIAAAVGCSPRTVRKWKARFASDPRLESLNDRHRSGRPARIPVWVRCELVALACQRPKQSQVPFRQVWTRATLGVALDLATGYRLSVAEIGRILRSNGLRPHRVRQWLKSKDPDFRKKAQRVCNLYLAPPLGAVVLSIDEKPMQALSRVSPTHVDHRDGSVRREYEYKRHGVQVLLAAFNVGTGDVFASVVPRRTALATVAFMEDVARAYPAQQIYVVWDNLNTHTDGRDNRWTEFNKRHGGRFHFVYTPKHASWMNQVEIWFSILHRRLLRYGSFDSVKDQRNEVLRYIRYWNLIERHPFRWTWRPTKRKTRRIA